MNNHHSLCPTPRPDLIDRNNCAYCNIIDAVIKNQGVEKYRSSLINNLNKRKNIASIIGDTYRAKALEDVIEIIEKDST